MTRWWRHALLAIADIAPAFPLRVQLDLGHGSILPVINGSALAKGDGAGNGDTGGGGNADNQGM